MMGKRGLAIAFYPHHVEHLAPVCALMGAPMLVCDSPGQAAAAQCYPDLAIEWLREVSFATPAKDVGARVRALAPDVIYYSHLFRRHLLRELLAGEGATPPRVVHCPHGFSEKRQNWAQEVAFQDIALLQGRHALDQLAELGVAPLLYYYVLGGNLRYAHYRNHQAFFDAKATELGVPADRQRRTILYAPTWNDKVGSSSFFSAFVPLVEGLPGSSRLVVKLHPHMENDAAAVDRLALLCRDRDNVVLLRNCPLTYPFLEQADVYVGDMSSLAYDFLVYDRPMVFLNQTHGTATDAGESRLFQCGVTVAPAEYAQLHRKLDEAQADSATFSARRAGLYRYTYAEEQSLDAVRAGLKSVCSGPAPTWMDPRWAARAPSAARG